MKRILHPWLALLALALAIALVVGRVSAQPSAASPPGAALDVAKKHMERGQELYAQKKYAEAADAFAAAYAAEPYAAFLYNEAVCHQKLGHLDLALEFFRKYLDADPNAPDAVPTRARIARIEAALAAAPPASAAADAAAPPPGDAGADLAPDAAAPSPASQPSVVDEPADMKSLVIIESEPPGAPVSVYLRESPTASPFVSGETNPGWSRVVSGSTPLNTTLDVGHYHIVIEAFADFHRSETDMDVAAGHVHQFKANLRQGEFLAFLRVTSPQSGARIYLDDPPPHKRPPWGTTPHEGLVGLGEHRVWVARAGFQTASRTFRLSHGEQRELIVELARASHGILRLSGNAPTIDIEVDGHPAGSFHTGAPLDVDLPAGTHELVGRADGRKTVTGTVQVPRGRVLPVDLVMTPKTPRGGAWTQAALSAVFLGGGAFLGLRSNSIYDDLRADRRAGSLTGDDDRYTTGKIYAIGADACFGIGALFAAFSTYSFIKDPTPPSEMRPGNAYDFPEPDGSPAPPRSDASPAPPHLDRPAAVRDDTPARERLELMPLAQPSAGGFAIQWRF